MSSTMEEEATISIPSLAFVAVLGYFIYRYFCSAPRAGGEGPAASSSRNTGLRFTPAQVDQIAQMFPQLNRRDIMWDLHRNRGNVQATTERVLTGRGLDPVSALIIQPFVLAIEHQVLIGFPCIGTAFISTAASIYSAFVGTHRSDYCVFVDSSVPTRPHLEIQSASQDQFQGQREGRRHTTARMG